MMCVYISVYFTLTRSRAHVKKSDSRADWNLSLRYPKEFISVCYNTLVNTPHLLKIFPRINLAGPYGTRHLKAS